MRSLIIWMAITLTSVTCLADANIAFLVSSPLEVKLTVEGKTLNLVGHFDVDIRLAKDELKENSFVADIRHFGVVVREVPWGELIIKPDLSGRRPIDVGISFIPGTSVTFQHDKTQRSLHAALPVEIDLPDTAHHDGFDEKNLDLSNGQGQKAVLELSLNLFQDLDKLQPDGIFELKASVVISLTASEFKDAHIHIKSFSALATSMAAKCQIVDLLINAVFQKMCIQPISVVGALNDPEPAGHALDINGNVTKDSLMAQRSAMDGLWGEVSGTVAGVKISSLPWIEHVAPALKVVTDGENGVLDSPIQFPNKSPNCVEVYFLERIVRESQHGAKTAGGGTQFARVILSDEIVNRGIHGRLAHEFGHVLKIPHPEGPPRGSDGYVGSTGTVACVYDPWDRDHPNRNSEDNIRKLRVHPLLHQGWAILPISQARPVECKNITDCGGC